MTTINSKANAAKRSLEGNVHTMQAEIDDMLHQAKNSEEKAKKAMVDAARLADELRAEQDHVSTQANAKRALETQMGELEQRLADANEMPCAVDVPQWLSLNPASESWRSSLETFRPTPLRAQRDTRRLSARSRSLPSRMTRTARTRTECPTLPPSCRPRSRHTRSRLRRLRKLLPSTLPNSARPSRSSRRLRREPGWLRVTSPPSGTRSASHDTQAEKDDDDHCIDLKLETAYCMLIYAS